MQFDVVKTNIVNVSADAVVLPANEKLKEGSGTSRAIFEAAGRKKLTAACKELRRCSTGSAVPTPAFNLDASYIIHAAVPKWIDGEKGEYNLLSSAYLSALNAADMLGCESIAFPLLSSGNNGFDPKLALKIADESIASFSGVKLKKVYLVVYGDSMEAFVRSQGYNVAVIPEKIVSDEKKIKHRKKRQEQISEGKDVALTFIEENTQKVLDWLKEEKNREKILSTAIQIVKSII